ncbi:MAG: hypothetical protein IT161_24200 [Bryobacterales bacterium]|nr:hypothetical protein [Bryobacterales bacterium]
MQREQAVSVQTRAPAAAVARESGPKKKLSYIEQRELDGMERKILDAEEAVQATQTEFSSASQAGDGARIEASYAALQAAEAEVERLYARWSELDARLK